MIFQHPSVKKYVDVSVYGEVRNSSTKVRDVLRNCGRDCSSLGSQDHTIMEGANDTARNETKNCMKTLKKTLVILTCMNVVLNISTRYDLIKESIVNKEIRKANVDINKICKRFRNVLSLSYVSRAYHTKHEQHLNRIGKKYITHKISKIIGKQKN
jgi:hypothetical protein